MKALILARLGSKGVKNKNIRLLNNKPLILYPIESAHKTKYIDEIYVSTDSVEIANIVENAGAKVIKRPQELAIDTSLDVDAFKHAVAQFDLKTRMEPLIHLRTTTPLIEAEILDKAIEYFWENEKKCTSLRSVQEISETVYKCFELNGKYLSGLFPNCVEKFGEEYYNLPRQKLPKTFSANGYIDVVFPKIFMNEDTFHGNRILAFETENIIEIDTEKQFLYLEYILKNRKI